MSARVPRTLPADPQLLVSPGKVHVTIINKLPAELLDQLLDAGHANGQWSQIRTLQVLPIHQGCPDVTDGVDGNDLQELLLTVDRAGTTFTGMQVHDYGVCRRYLFHVCLGGLARGLL